MIRDILCIFHIKNKERATEICCIIIMKATHPSTKILLTGASGYLGQHLLWHWIKTGIPEQDTTCTSPQKYIVVAVFHQNSAFASAVQEALASPPSKVQVIPISCDLTQQSSVDDLFEEHTIFDVCVHTAALASPQICQQDPDRARKMNVPEYFFRKLKSARLIALSTDQVYDGTKDTLTQGLYDEDADIPKPINVYAQTKLDMEKFLQKRQLVAKSSTIILRSSIILGPAPPSQAHNTFLHFCASRDQQETTFFTNEYRTVVGVAHICRVIDHFIALDRNKDDGSSSSGASVFAIYNMGGPVRVNRYDLAQAVFDHLGYDRKFILSAEQTSSTSPLDISMNSRRLEEATKIVHEPKTLKGIVESSF